jgi:hypothetical protein
MSKYTENYFNKTNITLHYRTIYIIKCSWHHTNRAGTSDMWSICGPFTATDERRSLRKNLKCLCSFICFQLHRLGSINYKEMLSLPHSEALGPQLLSFYFMIWRNILYLFTKTRIAFKIHNMVTGERHHTSAQMH